MGIEIANVWHFDLRLYLKPALGELYRNGSVCTKIRLFKIQYQKIFWEGGTAPSLDPSPGGEGNTPSPHPTPIYDPDMMTSDVTHHVAL